MFPVQLNNCLKSSKEDFGGVSIITIGDLFQLKPVMDDYMFTDVQCLNSYNILVANLWRNYFKMFELDEIMRQRGKTGKSKPIHRRYTTYLDSYQTRYDAVCCR